MEQYHWSRMRCGNKRKKISWFSSFIVLKPRDVGLSFNLTLETVRKYGRHCPSTSHKWPGSPCTAVHCTISERKKNENDTLKECKGEVLLQISTCLILSFPLGSSSKVTSELRLSLTHYWIFQSPVHSLLSYYSLYVSL